MTEQSRVNADTDPLSDMNVSTKDVLAAITECDSMPTTIENELHFARSISPVRFEQLQADIAEYNMLPGIAEIIVKHYAALSYVDEKKRIPVAYVRFNFHTVTSGDKLSIRVLHELIKVFAPYTSNPRHLRREIVAVLTRVKMQPAAPVEQDAPKRRKRMRFPSLKAIEAVRDTIVPGTAERAIDGINAAMAVLNSVPTSSAAASTHKN